MDTNISLSYFNFEAIPEISALLVQCWKYAYKGLINEDYLSSLKDNHWTEFLEKSMNDKTSECIVAKSGKQMVGVSIFGKSITEKFSNDGEIISLYVLPEFMGKNVGHLLFEKAQKDIKEEGYSNCTICTFAGNLRAIKFYKSHGYETVFQDEVITMGTQDVSYVILRKPL